MFFGGVIPFNRVGDLVFDQIMDSFFCIIKVWGSYRVD